MKGLFLHLQRSSVQAIPRSAAFFWIFAALFACSYQGGMAAAPYPVWWTARGAVNLNSTVDDYTAINVGQLKSMATAAAMEIEAIHGSMGPTLTPLIQQWELSNQDAVVGDDYAAVNVGMLKYVASKFYDRLGYPYPWSGNLLPKDDYALANLGQLKSVFSFPMKTFISDPVPVGTAGSASYAEYSAKMATAQARYSALTNSQKPAGSTATDFDGDGISNLQEFMMGTLLDNEVDLSGDGVINETHDWVDWDGDGIPNKIEDMHPGILNKSRFADAVEDKALSSLPGDLDGVMNFEEILLGLKPGLPNTSGRSDSLNDNQVLAWGLLHGSPSLAWSSDAVRACWEHPISQVWLQEQGVPHKTHWLIVTDGPDAGTTPDGLDAFRLEAPGALAQRLVVFTGAVTDHDSDGLSDLWEYKYRLDLRKDDLNLDPDGDGLTNNSEFIRATNPRLYDTDGDGYGDGAEVAASTSATDASRIPPVEMTLLASASVNLFMGMTSSPVSVRIAKGGIPLPAVNVTFSIISGSGAVFSNASPPATSLVVPTGVDGVAYVYFQAGNAAGTSTIRVSAATGTTTTTKTVSITVQPLPSAMTNVASGQINDGGYQGEAFSTAKNQDQYNVQFGDSADGFNIGWRKKIGSGGYSKRDGNRTGYSGGSVKNDLKYTYNSPRDSTIDLSSTIIQEFASTSFDMGFNYTKFDGGGAPFSCQSSNFDAAIPDSAPSTKKTKYHDVQMQHWRLIFYPRQSSAIPYRPNHTPATRMYLVRVYDIGRESYPDTNTKTLKQSGILSFHHTDTGDRKITLSGNVGPEFVLVDNGNNIVTVKPPMPSGSIQTYEVEFSLIEVMQRKINADGTVGNFAAVSELRPTRWRNMFINGNESLIDDPDEIRIALPRLRDPQETCWLKLGVTGITGKSTSISNDGDDVVAIWQSDSAGMPPLHLVTDSTDDHFSGFPADTTTPKDDYDADRTHLVSLGSTVELKIESSEGGNLPPIRIPVKEPDGKVEFRAFVLSPNGLGGGGQFASIRHEAKIAHEVYEQIGVSMEWLGTQTAPFPDNLPSSIPLSDPTYELTDDQAYLLADLLPDFTNSRVIDVYYLPCRMKDTTRAITVRSLKPGKKNYHVVLISTQRTSLSLAHELCHACGRQGHQPAPNRPWWLMKKGGTIDDMGILNSKRFSLEEEQIVKSTENAYYIPFH